MHFPDEILPNTIFSSKSMQPDKNIHVFFNGVCIMETEDTKNILPN